MTGTSSREDASEGFARLSWGVLAACYAPLFAIALYGLYALYRDPRLDVILALVAAIVSVVAAFVVGWLVCRRDAARGRPSRRGLLIGLAIGWVGLLTVEMYAVGTVLGSVWGLVPGLLLALAAGAWQTNELRKTGWKIEYTKERENPDPNRWTSPF